MDDSFLGQILRIYAFRHAFAHTERRLEREKER